METEAFEKYFAQLARKTEDILMQYIDAEETAYRRLQRILKSATEDGEEEYSSDDTSKTRQFQLPKRLRGWHFLEHAAIPLKEHSGILHQTGGMNIDKLKKVMSESFTERVLKDIDSRTTPKAPWQKRPRDLRKKRFSTYYTTEVSEDEDVNALDETDEDDLEFERDDQSDDQAAYVDEEGWFYADEDTINAVDETIAYDDEEFAQMVITYTDARNALARARIARGFYPIVVPADDGRQPRFSRTSKKGDAKGKSKGEGKTSKRKGASKSTYVPQTSTVPGTSSGSTSIGGKDGGKGKPPPICFRCGKRGHLSRN